MWYLDDGTIVGDLAALNSVACRLQEQLATIGLEINVGKCHIMSSSSPGPYSMLRLMHYHAVIPSDGVRVLGVPEVYSKFHRFNFGQNGNLL